MIKDREIRYNVLLLVIIYATTVLGEFVLANKEEVSFVGIAVITTFFVVSSVVYFTNYLWVMPKYFAPRQYGKYAIACVGLVGMFAGVRFILEEIILFQLTGVHNYWLESEGIWKVYLTDSLYYTFIIVVISSLVYLLFRNNEKANQIYALELEHQQAQLSVLKSQLSPHFLFNTLNSFYVELFDAQPEMANDILKLCNLLRYVTYETTADFVPLEKEITFINDYLYFFERRYEDNFHVNLYIEGIVTNQVIPSLIFIHFVENVCKHGLITQASKPAEIHIKINADTLEIYTVNYRNESEKYHESGIGTANIQKRLEVLFQGDFKMENKAENNKFEAYLRIPLNKK